MTASDPNNQTRSFQVSQARAIHCFRALCRRRFWVAGLGLLLSLGPVVAQKGDKSGEVQNARVPREKIPPAPPLSPEEALRTLRVQPGFRVELVAHEPMVEVPVLVQFDEDGRLWVVEMRGFMPNPDGHGETNRVGRISILEDTDGDGRMDARKVFVDGLVLPRALLLVKGGALICEPPHLWFYPNHDDCAGERVLVAENFAKDADPALGVRMNPEHSGNSLLWGMDNWVYSLYHNFRYRFEQGKWRREPMPRRTQWGLARDDFGRLFYTSNSDQLRGDMAPSHYGAGRPEGAKLPGIAFQVARDQSVFPIRVNPGVNRGYQDGTLRPDGTLAKFTAACGTCIYRGDLFPPDLYGNAFICEPSANVIRRNLLSDVDGLVTARNAYPQAEFLASTDELFRPVNLQTGPDGALYIVDMYHGIIQHRFFLTSYLRRQAEDRGIDKLTGRGRIYRVVPDGKSPARAAGARPRLSLAPSAALVKHLSHGNGWWRDTAQRLLVDRADPSVVPDLEALAAQGRPVARLHALWTLEGMGRLRAAVIARAIGDEDAKVRAAGVRLAEPCLRVSGTDKACAAVAEKVHAAVADPSPEVKLQAALSLGLVAGVPRAKEALTQLKMSGQPLVRDAAAFGLAALDAPQPAPTGPAAPPLTGVDLKRFTDGKAMYEATCLACHQQHGMGQPGLAPPLAGSEWVTGSPERLIRIVLHGVRGPIQVQGQTYELDMPSLGVLDDEQIASVLTYVRREWGHAAPPVTPERVKKARAETESREQAWTAKELLVIP